MVIFYKPNSSFDHLTLFDIFLSSISIFVITKNIYTVLVYLNNKNAYCINMTAMIFFPTQLHYYTERKKIRVRRVKQKIIYF